MSDIVKKDSQALDRVGSGSSGTPNAEVQVKDFLGNEGKIRYDKVDGSHKLEVGTRDMMGNQSYVKIEWGNK